MNRSIFTLVFALTAVGSVLAGGQADQRDQEASVIVFAAASTTDFVQDLAALYKQKTGTTVLVSPASSGILAKQLEEGAPADVYISASRKWMDFVVDRGLVDESRAMAGNRLVLIAPSDSEDTAVDITAALDFPSSFEGRLSMGDPEHVPAGAYAKESLEYFHWYDPLTARLLPAANVRAALAVVELGECDRGVVYRTDALKSGKVKIIGTFPPESHTPVSYYCASLKQASAEGQKFYSFLSGEESEGILRKYGFEGIQ